MLLYEGHQIYFGPRQEAKKYFVDMGYECPPRQTTADFLTSLTNPEERIVRPGFEGKVPRTSDEFADAWRMSAHKANLLRDIAAFQNRYPVGGEEVEKLTNIKKAQKARFMYATPSSPCITHANPPKVQEESIHDFRTHADPSVHDQGSPEAPRRQDLLHRHCRRKPVHVIGPRQCVL